MNSLSVNAYFISRPNAILVPLQACIHGLETTIPIVSTNIFPSNRKIISQTYIKSVLMYLRIYILK